MPTFSTFSSLSKNGFTGGTTSIISATNFLNVVTPSSPGNILTATSGVITGDGGTVCVGSAYVNANGFPTDGSIFRTDEYGNITFQVGLGTTGTGDNTTELNEILLGPSDSLYAVGSYYPTGAGGRDSLVVKVDNTLGIVWQKTLYTSDGETTYCGAIGSSYLYLGGETGATGNVSVLSSYDLSGTLNFQKTVGNNCNRVDSLFVDNSDNYYVIANEIAGAGVQGVQLMKWNSSNSYQWGRRITGPSDIPFNANTTDVVVDTSGNVYVSLWISNTVYILKYDSTGSLQGQIKIDTSIDNLMGMTIDGGGNTYVLALVDANTMLLISFDSGGSILWQNTIVGIPVNNRFIPTINSLNYASNNLIITTSQQISTTPPRKGYTITLPSDGSKTGSYASLITYASSSYTVSTSTLTDASQSDVSSTTSYTDATANVSSSTTSFTQSVTAI